MNTINTKEKIIQTAHRLFSEKGFNGVSIREISKEADVNISAVNYHFQNKENLYFETIKNSIQETAEKIKQISYDYKDREVEDMILAIFDFFSQNREEVITSFKLILDNSNVDFSNMNCDLMDEKEELIGPPGGLAIFEHIKLQIPNAKDEDIIWAVRVLFTQVIHKSIIYCKNIQVKQTNEQKLEMFRQELRRLIRVTLFELESPRFGF